jgi:hypothetical protein
MFQVFYMAVVMVAVGAAVVWSLDFGKELTQAAGEIARQSASAPATYGAPDSPSAPTPAAEQFAGYGEELVIRISWGSTSTTTTTARSFRPPMGSCGVRR